MNHYADKEKTLNCANATTSPTPPTKRGEISHGNTIRGNKSQINIQTTQNIQGPISEYKIKKWRNYQNRRTFAQGSPRGHVINTSPGNRALRIS